MAAAVSINTIKMSTTQSAEEINKEQIAVLGPDFGSLYNLLYTLDDGLKERENYFNRSGTWNTGDINIDPNEIK